MSELLRTDNNYSAWLTELKSKIRSVQIKAAVQVNTEILNFYWELGADIVEKQTHSSWGDGFLSKLSRDLMREFSDIKGFSFRNLKYIRQWYLFWSSLPIGQQVVAQLSQVPWGHNIAIISKCQDVTEAGYYVQNTLQHNWSRAVLVHQIERKLYQREGKAVDAQYKRGGNE